MAGRVSRVEFSCPPPRPRRLDIVGIARTGDEIEGRVPRRGRILQAIVLAPCTAVTGCMEEVETPQEPVSEGILLGHQPTDWSLRSLKGVAPCAART